MSYMWKHELEMRGYVAKPKENFDEYERKVDNYVNQYLSPSIQHAGCGWDRCILEPMVCAGHTEEYIALYCGNTARYINVSGNSLGAVAEAVWKNVFN